MTALAVSTTKLPPAYVGLAYEASVACTSVDGSITLSAGSTQTNKQALPASLTYGADGRITGTPVAGDQGVYNLSVKATGSGSDTAQDNIALTLYIYGEPGRSEAIADRTVAERAKLNGIN